jgi:hypothetical protein
VKDQTKPSEPAAPTPGPGDVKDEDLAVAADFEAEAEEQITEANYEKELDALDKEIASAE